MKFRDYFSVKHILFAVVLMALMLLFAVRQSNNTVKVYFDQQTVDVTSAKYSMSIQYSDIVSAELVALPEAGEKVADGYDDDILRAGVWKNDTLGEYIIVADLDVDTCILIQIQDGRTLIFSRKNLKATTEDYNTLLTYLPNM